MAQVSAVQKAVNACDGSPSKLATAIGDGVLRQHVEHWLKAGRVPPERCVAVSNLTGVPKWELRPDDWHKIWPELIGADGAPVPSTDKQGA
jgi:DNA-binding transcriptional regulator YdaS (Cro superfamily)